MSDRCYQCGKEITAFQFRHYDHKGARHNVCPSEAERSEVPEGCTPSAACSARPSAVAHPSAAVSSVVRRDEEPNRREQDASLACDVCRNIFQAELITHLRIYVAGSEGVNVCLTCRQTLTEVLRGMMRTAHAGRKQGYLAAKQVAAAKQANLTPGPGGAHPCGERAVAPNAPGEPLPPGKDSQQH